MRRPKGFAIRWYITLSGIIVLVAASLELSDGQRHGALVGYILGFAMIVGNEWWEWKKRSGG
jgi:hypothetical protein